MIAAFRRFLASRDPERHEREWEQARNLIRVALLRRFILTGDRGAELGVHKGYFSRALLAGLAPAHLYLIDPWYRQGREWSWGSGNRSTVDALCRVLREFESELVSGRVTVVIDDDLDALRALPERHLDWAYIDTTHQYEHTCAELSLLASRVKGEGIIAGDDWQADPSHRHHGVFLAVHEFVRREGHSLLYADPKSLQWVVRLAVRPEASRRHA